MTRKLALSVEQSLKDSSGKNTWLPGDNLLNKRPGLHRQYFSLDRSQEESLLRESELLAEKVRLSRLQSCNGCPLRDM